MKKQLLKFGMLFGFALILGACGNSEEATTTEEGTDATEQTAPVQEEAPVQEAAPAEAPAEGGSTGTVVQ